MTRFRDFIESTNEPDYLYWDKAKYKPTPGGLSHEQAWFAVKLSRLFRFQPAPIKRDDGKLFQWVKLSGFEKFCHEFDMNTGGELLTSISDLKREERQRLISKGIMDEAIASSQLEGADTGREYARKMLREGIKPRNQADRMILNNHNLLTDKLPIWLRSQTTREKRTSSMLHFWIGYLHPFTDGNGRLARVIFYWYLLKKNYWAFAYLPLSAYIKRSKKAYTMAYVYTEQDEADLTYFLSYQFKKIREASAGFQEYLARLRKSNIEMARGARIKLNLNERQIQLVRYLSGNKDYYTSIKTHTSVHAISRVTAISDLKKLREKGYLIKKRVGRNTYYYGTEKIESLFSH